MVLNQRLLGHVPGTVKEPAIPAVNAHMDNYLVGCKKHQITSLRSLEINFLQTICEYLLF